MRAEFMGNIGIEAAHLPVGIVQATEQFVELLDSRLQFFHRRMVEAQALAMSVDAQRTGLLGKPVQGSQGSPDDPEAR